MRTLFLSVIWILLSAQQISAQRECSAYLYQHQLLLNNPSLSDEIKKVENSVQRPQAGKPQGAEKVIIIPVVVHILYNKPEENISDERVFSQIKVLNECFRRLNADTVNTPAAFKSLGADCAIEFKLAISDPQRRATSGIIRKYTPVTRWDTDDKIKIAAETGSDPWDPKYYLNVWVCNLGSTAGYSSFPGGPAEKDGIVIAYNVFGINKKRGYELGKTAVHEAGHWLGLRHIWGDSYCGDDAIDDTPRQTTFTSGCPSGIRLSCGSGSNGDMYMNYMDITLDACTNLFTSGQKERMRASFETGGGRKSIINSYGLLPPLFSEVPLHEELPTWYYPNLYPNPTQGQMTLDIAYDIRWIGKKMTVTNMQGIKVKEFQISSKSQVINMNDLKPGVYILSGEKEGSSIRQKFIKI